MLMIKNKLFRKKTNRMFLLSLISLIFALLCYILVIFFNGNLSNQVYISFLFVAVESVFFGVFISDIINNYILTKFRFRYKTPPQIFEFLFFLFLFLATLFVTYMSLYNNANTVNDVFTFIQYNWLWILSYGFAMVFGYFHYFRRSDCP